MNLQELQKTIDVIKSRLPEGFTPQYGMILGSGLGPLADKIENGVTLAYEELPGLPISSVSGHAGSLVLGYLKGVPVACLKGRVHYYEGTDNSGFKALIRLLKVLGCHSVVITNSSGSLRKEIGRGELVIINDHINFQFRNPLIGPNDDEFGDRFFPLCDTYDDDMRTAFHKAANSTDIKMHEGVYISVLGPCFETPAEIRAFRILGADVIGMSTVPDVLVAKHCGLKVTVIAAITNLSADINPEPITHEGTLKYGKMASENLSAVIERFFETM